MMGFRVTYLFLIFFVSWSTLLCSAQSDNDTIKRLLTKLNNSKDQEKAKLYNSIAQKFIGSDPQLALVYADSALQKANHNSDFFNIFMALYNAGKANYELDRDEQSITSFLEAL